MEPSSEEANAAETVQPSKLAKSLELPQATSEQVMVNGVVEDGSGHSPAAAGGDSVSVKAAMEDAVIAAAAAAAAEAEHVAPEPSPDVVKEVKDTPKDEKQNGTEPETTGAKPKPKKAAKKAKPVSDSAENSNNSTKGNSASSSTPSDIPNAKQKRQRKRKSDPDFIEDPRLSKTMNGEVPTTGKNAETVAPPKPKKKKVPVSKKESADKPKDTNKRQRKSPAKSIDVSGKDEKDNKKDEVSGGTVACEPSAEPTPSSEESTTKAAASNQCESATEHSDTTDNAPNLEGVSSSKPEPESASETSMENKSSVQPAANKDTGKSKSKKAKTATATAAAVAAKPDKKGKDKADSKKKADKPKKKSVKKKKAETQEDDEMKETGSAAEGPESKEKNSTASKDNSPQAAADTEDVQEKPKKKYAKKKKKKEENADEAGKEEKGVEAESKNKTRSSAGSKAKKPAAKKKPKKADKSETDNQSPQKDEKSQSSSVEKDQPAKGIEAADNSSSESKENDQRQQEQTEKTAAAPKKEKKKKSAAKVKEASDIKPKSSSGENEHQSANAKDNENTELANVESSAPAEKLEDNVTESTSKEASEPAGDKVSEPAKEDCSDSAKTDETLEEGRDEKSATESKDKQDHTSREPELRTKAPVGDEASKFSCRHCDYHGKNKASLLKHLKNHHGIYQCSHCEFTSTTKENMDEHMKSHPSSKWGKRKCPKCIRFIEPEDFEDHEKTCSGKPEPIVCPECKKEFRFKAMFETHFKSHQTLKQPKATKPPPAGSTGAKKCHKCGRRYSREDLESHSKSCDGTPVPFVCPECKKEFRFMAKLRNHMKIHLKHEDMEFQCDICDYKTPFFGYLEKHMGAMHDKNREKTVPCPDCQKLFYTNSNMQNHVRYSCVTQDPHKCEVCGITVKSLDALRRHKVSHDEEKNVLCDAEDCSMTFKTKRHLTYHKKNVHGEGIKKFKCTHPNCEESFLKKSQMTRHLSVHTGDRKYVCQYDGCSKAFRHPDNLKVHTLQHTNEKPIKCELCEYACRQRSSIQHHMRTKHPSHPFVIKRHKHGKGDSDTSGSGSGSLSDGSCKDIYDFNDEDEKSSLPPLAKNASKSPRPKVLPEYTLPINANLSSPEQKSAKKKKAVDSSQEQDTDSDRPPQKKKKKAPSKESKDAASKKKKSKKEQREQERKEMEEAMMAETEDEDEEDEGERGGAGGAGGGVGGGEGEKDSIEESAQRSLDSNLDYSGSTSGDLVPETFSPTNDQLETSGHTVQDGDDELPADFDPEKHMAEAFGPEAAYDIADMGPVGDPEQLEHPTMAGQHGHNETGSFPTTTAASNFVPPLHGITEPVTGEALVEKMKEDFSEEQLEQLAKETQEELNAVMSAGHMGHTAERLNSIGSHHGEENYPAGVEVPVITSHHQGAPHSAEYSAPSSNLPPPPSHEAPSSIPPPSNEPVPSQEPPGYPMSHDSQRNYTGYSGTGETGNPGTDTAVTVGNGHPASADAPASESSLPPYSSAVPYPDSFPPVSSTSSGHDTAPSSSYTAPLSSPYLSPTYPMPLPSTLPTFDSSTYNQPATSRSQESLSNSESQPSGLPSRTPESLYPSTSRGVTSTSTFPTDSFSRELFGQYFQDPSSMPLTHPPMSQDPQRPSYLPQQQPGFPMLSRTSTDLLRRPPMMPTGGYGSMAESLVGMNPALGQQPGQQSWIGHDERSRTWSQAIMGGPSHELSTGSPLSAATRNPYSERPDYPFDPNASSQLGRRPGESSFPVPQTLANPTQHYDMASAYMTARSLNPASQESSYSRAVGSAATNSQNRLEDAYRHMTDYRTLPQPPSMADMYGRMGMNPALGLDKYYYPARDAVYRSHNITSTTNPFLPPTSTAQMGYSDREYSRNAMYSQHSAYGFMGDKQFLPSTKITPGVPSPADYFQPRPGATDPHIQDPYRRIYNMMSRYY